jgi:hypothetical protein
VVVEADLTTATGPEAPVALAALVTVPLVVMLFKGRAALARRILVVVVAELAT